MLKSFFKNEEGTSTVEFVLTVFGYFFVLMMIFEFSRLAISSAYWDLAITESTRYAKNQEATQDAPDNYKELFEKALNEWQVQAKKNFVGFFAIQTNSTKIEVNYADNISDLLNGKFRAPTTDSNGKLIAPTGTGASVALYSLEYDYEFISSLPFLPKSWAKSIFNRKIVAVQEYETDK